LNEWEQLNIAQGESWARKQRKEIVGGAFGPASFHMG